MQTTDHEPVQFQSEGLTIISLICETKTLEDGSTAFLIRSSYLGRHAENWHTSAAGSPISKDILRNAQKHFAEQFALDLRGLAKSPAFPLVYLSNPTDDAQQLRVIASVDLESPITLIHPDLLRVLNIQRPPGTETHKHPSFGVPTFQLRIKFGNKTLDQAVHALPRMSQGFMCILGNDFRDAMRDLDWQLCQKLVEDNTTKAYRLGAQARENAVLLIGSYQGKNRELLSKIAEILFNKGYRGLILDEFPDIPDNSLEQKLLFLCAISKFVLCIDTSPAGHYVELSICARFGIITALLTNSDDGKESTAMLYDLKVRNRFAEVFIFDQDDIKETIDKVLSWASGACAEKRTFYDSIYNWRRHHPGE